MTQGTRIERVCWFTPQDGDVHESAVAVLFAVCAAYGAPRFALALSQDRHGFWFMHEYRREWDGERGYYAAAQRTYEPGGDRLINMLGDPLDAWVVRGQLPAQEG